MDSTELRQIFGQFATGITVVCTCDKQGRSYGITVNSFSSVSLEPPLALFCLDKQSETLLPVLETGILSFNILGAGQSALSNRMATKGGVEKMRGLDTKTSVSGAPILKDCVAYLDGRIYQTHEAGDHYIIVAEILDIGLGERQEPGLLYYRSAYRGIGDEINE